MLPARPGPQEPHMPGVIVIVENFTFAAANGQSINTPWIQFPAEYSKAQINVTVKSRVSGTLVAQMQASWDTDSKVDVGTAISANAQGTSLQDVTSGLGPLVRFNLLASAADTIMVISIYVTPKIS
jgi:hypothetical protein